MSTSLSSPPSAPLPLEVLLPPRHDRLIAIDSDGCAFDSMELKQKECFIPNIIAYWGLQPVAKYAREAAEFLNLYSIWRGASRFRNLVRLFDLLETHPGARWRDFDPPAVPGLRRWLAEEPEPSNPSLRRRCEAMPSPDLERARAWTEAIDQSVADIVGAGIPPFRWVRESIEAATRADIMVCSVAPLRTLRAEWEGQGLVRHHSTIGGQENGGKARMLRTAGGGRYPKENVLMIGDGPGDRAAAKEAGAWFYPIVPNDEDASWRRFHEESLGLFLSGNYDEDYQRARERPFLAALPETPPWENDHRQGTD